MAEYFVKIHGFEKENPKNIFLGAFDNKNVAQLVIEHAKEVPDLEVVIDDNKPVQSAKAIHMEVTTKIAAQKAGLRSTLYGDDENASTLIGTELPDNILDLVNVSAEPEEKSKRGRKPGVPNKPKTVRGVAVTEKLPEVPQTSDEPYETTSLQGNGFGLDKLINQFRKDMGFNPEVLIVTKYPGTVNWLRQNGIDGRVVDRVRNPNQIKDAIVIGVLPPRLASMTYRLGNIDLPKLTVDQLGKPLSAQELEEAGASIKWYIVREG